MAHVLPCHDSKCTHPIHNTPPVDSKGAAINKILYDFYSRHWNAVKLQDTEARDKALEEAKQAILAILAQEVKKARIDELERLSKSKWADLAYDIPFYLQERIAKLKEER